MTRYLLPFLLLPFCLSCRGGRTDVPAAVQEHPVVAYEDTVYCFNQRSIVSAGGLKGVIDDDGQVILSPEWDSIEFLSDEVALLSRSGLWYLCTRDGRLFAESGNPSDLETSFRERLAEMQDLDLAYWDAVLDQLDQLRAACLQASSRRVDARIRQERARLDGLLADAGRGSMSRAQLDRLGQILSDFNSMYRR